MPEKRKDSKGRVLKDGESQRANGTYDYRYTDIHKKRRCIYAKSLTELRKKEEELWRDLADGIDYAAGEMTVADLVDRYMNLKRGLKPNSLRSYNTAVKRIHADPFGQKAIKTVKLSDAKGWFVFLHDSGFKQNTIGILQSVVRPAFEMAVEDDIIRKNPFKFKLSDVVPKDAYVRDALTREQQEEYLQFVQDYGCNYYDDIVILMGTGLRVSDADGKISLNQQKPSKHAGLRRFGPEKFLQRNNEFMKERPIFYKKPIKTEKDFSTWLRCFYYTTKAVITEYIYF